MMLMGGFLLFTTPAKTAIIHTYTVERVMK